jgi:hypothetical protein
MRQANARRRFAFRSVTRFRAQQPDGQFSAARAGFSFAICFTVA